MIAPIVTVRGAASPAAPSSSRRPTAQLLVVHRRAAAPPTSPSASACSGIAVHDLGLQSVGEERRRSSPRPRRPPRRPARMPDSCERVRRDDVGQPATASSTACGGSRTCAAPRGCSRSWPPGRRSRWTEACVEAAITPAALTRAIPIIRAPAVFAVRRGLRVTFPRASRARGRIVATSGAASTPMTRPASAGESTSTPSSTALAPTDRRVRGSRSSTRAQPLGLADAEPPSHEASTSSPPPTSVMRAPTSALVPVPRSGATSSCMAWTGGVRAARRAGREAARRLTPTPTASARPIAREAERDAAGQLHAPGPRGRRAAAPRARVRAARPRRSRGARRRPPAVRIDAKTCAGDAPRARRSANSRRPLRARTSRTCW